MIKQQEVEYSKVWATNNPAIFTADVLAFLEGHPQDLWTIEASQTKGFFTFRATLKS